MTLPTSPLALSALVCATAAAAILVAFLVRRPVLHGLTKVWLLLGLGVLPIAAATAGNLEGFHETKQRTFCGSCHVMTPQAADAMDPLSKTLASRHSRNKLFGNESCYMCHADYGMYGTVLTKMGGMRHVWLYYTQYRTMPLEESKKAIHLLAPYPNQNCMQCHSTENALFMRVPDHRSSLADVRDGKMSCASRGCHGTAHPVAPSEDGGAP